MSQRNINTNFGYTVQLAWRKEQAYYAGETLRIGGASYDRHGITATRYEIIRYMLRRLLNAGYVVLATERGMR